MNSDKRFDLEQNIMDAWHVVDDIDTIYQRLEELSADELMNVLLGLKTLYQLKFEKLFENFEQYTTEHQKQELKDWMEFGDVPKLDPLFDDPDVYR